MFHRLAGVGVQEAYDATLKLSGATVLDGVLFRFKITFVSFLSSISSDASIIPPLTMAPSLSLYLPYSDAYFNPETYNYSESLSRDDGFSGFRFVQSSSFASHRRSPSRSLTSFLPLFILDQQIQQQERICL